MTKLILSTSNIMSGGSSAVRHDMTSRSNAELTSSLRMNFKAAQEDAAYAHMQTQPQTNGHSDAVSHTPSFKDWTSHHAGKAVLYVPTLDFTASALQEEREQYDITLKLFYLPGIPVARRASQTREALDFVLQELHVPSIDLLIVSFPGIYFDEESEGCPDKIQSRGPIEADPEPLETQIKTWQELEKLKDEGLVGRLGVSEFGAERLQPFLERTRIKPSVDQINLRDCCSVPRPLLTFAKKEKIDLLVHNDSTNILPRGTLRELLGSGENGAGVLANDGDIAGDKRKNRDGGEAVASEGMKGDVEPQWVIKYTAVVINRGVVENKGYFAAAELKA
ncbi:hypothetical protein LTR66_010410 [Elasticomyces elasticus]|nr:hypothetical protein LTR28_005407 [Elasticomyces elasticus]KAK4979619.1 hypothetical protein LTR66_010410 [Elasticomyces elasticus]KAK4993411.1 hypothetical protein LTR50_000341 [Elasticomyces elasticus]